MITNEESAAEIFSELGIGTPSTTGVAAPPDPVTDGTRERRLAFAQWLEASIMLREAERAQASAGQRLKDSALALAEAEARVARHVSPGERLLHVLYHGDTYLVRAARDADDTVTLALVTPEQI